MIFPFRSKIKRVLLITILFFFSFIFISNNYLENNRVEALNSCCGIGCGGCYSANPCGTGRCTTWVTCNAYVGGSCSGLGNGSQWFCYYPNSSGSCASGGGGGGGGGGTAPGSTCTGVNPECRSDISNCGQIGKVTGSGSCSSGLCCVEPSVSSCTCPYDGGSGLGENQCYTYDYDNRWQGTYMAYYCGYCSGTGGAFQNRGTHNSVGANNLCYNDYSITYQCNQSTNEVRLIWNKTPAYYWNISFGTSLQYVNGFNNSGIISGSGFGPHSYTWSSNYSAGTQSMNFTNITPSTNYSFRVGAVNTYQTNTSVVSEDINAQTITFSCPPTCSSTIPSTFSNQTPANGTTISSYYSTTLTWTDTSWGQGCPQNNSYTIFTGSTSTGPWTNRGTSTSSSFNLTGLSAGTTYFWYVQKNNGSQSVNSSVTSFTTVALPTHTFTGQILTDVCGRGFSGRAGSGVSGVTVTNPARFRTTITIPNNDRMGDGYFVMIPRNLSAGSAKIPIATAISHVVSSNGIYSAVGSWSGTNIGARTTSVASNNGTSWSSSSTTGSDHTVTAGSTTTATMLTINSAPNGTYGEITGTNTYQLNFLVRFENGMGSTVSSTNTTGVWDIYSLAIIFDSNNNTYYENDFTRIGQWGIDLNPPSAAITGPTYQSNGVFNMTYVANDIGPALTGMTNYIVRSDQSATLTDQTLNQNLLFNGQFTIANDQHSGSVGLSNYLTQPTRTYASNNVSGNTFSFLYDVTDTGCNYVRTTNTVSSPTPWILTRGGNTSVNGSVQLGGATTPLSIPTQFRVTNVALNKSATQSSLFESNSIYAASKAVDGNTDGIFSNNASSSTQSESQPWWQVDLGSSFNISTISIWNRTDSFPERLSNYYIFVSSTPFPSNNLSTLLATSGVTSYFQSSQAGTPSNIAINTLGRYVRIQLQSTNQILTIPEVQVFAGNNSLSLTLPAGGGSTGVYTNGALGRTATQSSTLTAGYPWIASLAVDGSVPGDSTSTTHTNLDANAWWEVDLGSVQEILNIYLWNRADCCQNRLSNYYILVSDTPFSSTSLSTTLAQAGVSNFYRAPNAGSPEVININRTGRYVRLQLNKTDYLSIREVFIHTKTTTVSGNLAQGGSTSQSSTLPGWPWGTADKAVDGNSGGGFYSTTHTDLNTNAWWQVDLGSVRNLSNVLIYNRSDSLGSCCISRLSNYYLLVSNDPFTSTALSPTLSQTGVSNYYQAGNAGFPTTIPVNRTGRYIRIQLNKTDYLHMDEVIIQGVDVNLNLGGTEVFLSQYGSLSGQSQNISKPASTISQFLRYANNYINEAVDPIDTTFSTWYDYFSPIVQRNSTNIANFTTTSETSTGITQIPNAQTITGTSSSAFGITVNQKRNINVTGNIRISSGFICDTQSVILISGNLRIDPPFSTTSGSGCLFIVNGNISVGAGTNGSTVPFGSTQPNYDVLEASLIADDYIWLDSNIVDINSKGEGLYVRGGLITNGYVRNNRDINGLWNVLHPSVVIINNASNYSLFRDDLRTRNYSIREQQ